MRLFTLQNGVVSSLSAVVLLLMSVQVPAAVVAQTPGFPSLREVMSD